MANLVIEGEPTVTDFVVVTNAYSERDDQSTRPIVRFNPPRHIQGDIWIAQLDPALCTALLDACDAAGENFKPFRQYGCSYAFYRVNAPAHAGHELHFDSDIALYTCIALSRLAHPNATGFRWAARVMEWPNGARKIVPAEHTHLNRYAFVTDPNDSWLVPDDLPELRAFMTALKAQPLPPRLASALWHHEALTRHYFIDLRWPLLTTCLEALVRIRDERLPSGRYARSTKVFVDRLLRIGRMDAALAATESELKAMYEQRSLLTHGLAFGTLDEPRKDLYRLQEKIARGIIRRALLDPDFRSIFASDASLATSLPLRS